MVMDGCFGAFRPLVSPCARSPEWRRSFKIENDKDPTRDYLSAVRAGYMDKNASAIVANACG